MQRKPLLEQFITNIYNKNLFTKKDRLLIAVSGGVDSVVLCKLCELAGFQFHIAHCNFQLRGADSDRDEAFVENYAQKLNRPFHCIKFDTKAFAEINKLSTQEAARVLRYDWFESLRQENQLNYILTAHHADDNVETVLMSFFRGTGIKGLTGIKEKNGFVRRPLLFARRKDMEFFLNEYQLSYVQDYTNLTDDYTRNYFRNTLIPSIAKIFPEVSENLIHNIERIKDAFVLYQLSSAQLQKKLLKKVGAEWHIPILLLQKTNAAYTLLYEVLQPLGFTSRQIIEVMALLESGSGKYVASSSHRVLKDRKHLIISPIRKNSDTITIIESEGSYAFKNGIITINKINDERGLIVNDESIACLDESKIKYPLLLRPWRNGDYFYPLGMKKKKKLSRFFIDKKIPVSEKEKVWVLEMNKKIVWVIGYRIDDRFKVITQEHTRILQIKWSKPVASHHA